MFSASLGSMSFPCAICMTVCFFSLFVTTSFIYVRQLSLYFFSHHSSIPDPFLITELSERVYCFNGKKPQFCDPSFISVRPFCANRILGNILPLGVLLAKSFTPSPSHRSGISDTHLPRSFRCLFDEDLEKLYLHRISEPCGSPCGKHNVFLIWGNFVSP